MPRVTWPLAGNRPAIEVLLIGPPNVPAATRRLLADTGAGTRHSPFELVLNEADCLQLGDYTYQSVRLRGAYVGGFSIYTIRVQLPALAFDGYMRAVGAPSVATGLDGIAAFRFLNRFTYGNFGDPTRFGLEN